MTRAPARGPAATWRPFLGAVPGPGGTRFRIWAPAAARVELVLEQDGDPRAIPLAREADGLHSVWIPGTGAGARYRYRVDGKGPFPDPASRFQPEGVHGVSEVVDPADVSWSAVDWTGVPATHLVFYELHVGTFTPDATFRAIVPKLPYLRDLGVTAIELMPIAEFAGRRNWGYDGAALFAPEHAYGTPADLRGLVDAAHRHGLAVFLDVVYNHLGPDGAYLWVFSPEFFSRHHRSPWGSAVNLDGRERGIVRRILIENALYWLHEFRVDGLRLDATHALVDEREPTFLAELASHVRAADPACPRLLVAEDDRNLVRLVRPAPEGGAGLDAVWADDFHHQVHVRLTGERDGYYRDFSGSTPDLATTINDGWFYQGQFSAHRGAPRGTAAAGTDPARFVICLQNHDQVGNRAHGERLNHLVDPAAYRAAVCLLLVAPQTPLLFMGQEWAASTPFLYFTDHHDELGRQITEGRRHEFEKFAVFADPDGRRLIPDPQMDASYGASRLIWAELDEPWHAGVLRLHRVLLGLRHRHPALAPATRGAWRAQPLDAATLLILRSGPAGARLAAVIRLEGAGPVTIDPSHLALPGDPGETRPTADLEVVMTSEDEVFTRDGRPPVLEQGADSLTVRFRRPSAVLLGRVGGPARGRGTARKERRG